MAVVISQLTQTKIFRWPQLVPMLKDDPVCVHMENARNCLKTWRKPALIMFGDRYSHLHRYIWISNHFACFVVGSYNHNFYFSDPITKGAEAAFLTLIPHNQRIPVKGAKHFLQETHGKIVSENIIKFLGESK